VRISLPGRISRYVVEKGSIAVDGISLTVSALGPPGTGPAGSDRPAGPAGSESTAEPWFEVCLIPETLKRTTLGTRQPGDTVNLEVDVIAKYVERLLSGEGSK
jgi:riboflavin synthase